jgi:3-hydroxyacyl-[acyl-carrier-protein] dehydratase
MGLDIREIQEIIPHRFPFLMIDKIVDIRPNEKLTAIKNVSVNEHFFVGHFPEEKVMPGVLIIEAMAQAG